MKRLQASRLKPATILLIACSLALSACAGVHNRPTYPAMTDEQKEELRAVCNNDDDKKHFDPECRALEEWFGRVEKLKRQLERKTI